VLVAGGNVPPSQYSETTALIYDPIAGTWSSTASMALRRAFFTATVLQNGAVLVTAGYGQTGCELYW
jgi:hypothetical protein